MWLTASLRLARPPGFDDLSDDALIAGRLLEREKEPAAIATAEGRSFLGVKTVLAQHWNDATKEPRRKLDPRVAEKDRSRRIAALQRLVDFWLDYRAAWLRFAAGDHAAPFPQGTYAMRVRYGVFCADTA